MQLDRCKSPSIILRSYLLGIFDEECVGCFVDSL